MNKTIKAFLAIDKMLEKREYSSCYGSIKSCANTRFPLTTRTHIAEEALRQHYYEYCCKPECLIKSCPLCRAIRSRLMDGL